MSSSKLKLSKPKAVLFDWDNTIIISKSIFYNALHAAMEKLDLDKQLLSTKLFQENVHLSVRDSFPNIFGEKWEEAAELYKAHFSAVHLDNIQLMPDIVEILDILYNAGVIISVVSNKDGEFLRKEVKKAGLEHYFYAVVGACDANLDKPAPDPAYLALNGMFNKESFNNDIWFIGDSIADLECGYNSKCLPILFGNKPSEIRMAKEKGIDHLMVENYRELITFAENVMLDTKVEKIN